MLQERGVISEVNGSLATVITQNKLACSSCKVSSSCGNGIIEKYLSGKVFASEISNTIDAKVGDLVIIEMAKASITKASLVVYFVPLLSLILSSIFASNIGFSENFIILIGLLGLIFGFLVTKYYNQKIAKDELFLPKMVSIYDDLESNELIVNLDGDSKKSSNKQSIKIKSL